MPPKKNPPSLGTFGVKAPVPPPDASAQPLVTHGRGHERTRAKGEKVAIAVRLSREDWHRLHDFANWQGISIQKLIVVALAEHMQASGVTPLAGA